MVDIPLGGEGSGWARPKPLRWLYLDMNAYFASVEQAEDPSLVGRPVAVVPMLADSTFIIAASRECKKLGVKTGMRVGDAKLKIPEILLIPGRPALYVHYHRRIQEVTEQVLPINKVCSIDEMKYRLLGEEREPEEARKIAALMKRALFEGVSPVMTASVGIAPNAFLAKLGTDLQKPDGLVVIESKDLPEKIRGLKLTEFAGINRKMEARLKAVGIFTSDDMVTKSEQELRRAFQSVTGARWWYLIRGEELPEQADPQKSLSHSHVLPPELRTRQGARDVLLRLAHKAAARLRSKELEAGSLSIYVSGRGKGWEAHTHLDGCQDTFTLIQEILKLWEGADFESCQQVGLNLTDLFPFGQRTPSLFSDLEKKREAVKASQAMDAINQKFGKNSVFLASLEKVKGTATEKIAFNKTWLFAEGKGDHEWPNTFQGEQPQQSKILDI
jgi:DNA polymerase-4